MAGMQAPRGTQDVMPSESYVWQYIEQKARDICAGFGYREVRTPVFEHTEVFLRGVGDTTDVVQKEMYTFNDKGGRSITLKPEGTAGVARAMIEHKLYAEALPVKMYYLNCPVFRYESPQSGRLREHHQFGVEAFGAACATLDAEIISLAWAMIRSLGIENLRVSVNSIGCPKCREAYHEKLKAYLAERLDTLCATCNDRFSRNPLRILDCKSPACQAAVKDAPVMLDSLCDECSTHFGALRENLVALDIPFIVDARIVRGLDYYTKTVFEIITQTPNGPLTMCGGGRYDGLISILGGPDTCGIGFGMGVERLMMVLGAQGKLPAAKPIVDVFVCALPDGRAAALRLTDTLRKAGIRADMDHCQRSLKAQFKYADKTGAGRVVIVGGDELARGCVKIRNMQDKTEREVALGDAAGALKE